MAPTPPVLELDDFHFHTMDTTEDMTRYSPGGYHPIVIGDILHPSSEGSESGSRRYRITHKLAYGSYSTVWLAQKLDSSNAFVVVKVTTGDGDPTKEAAMLEAANKMQINGGHVVTLLDHFTLNGPNGTHPVLVTDIVAPILSIPKRPSFWYKAFAHGIVKAVAQLQDARIVHGDLHLGNIGVAIPELAYQDPHEVMITLLTYDITVVLPVSATLQTPSLPPYIIMPSDIGNYYNRIARSGLPQTKIYDFGSAPEAGTPPLSFQCAVEACAPEMAFARVVEKIDNPPVEPPADVWALGAAIYEIVLDPHSSMLE